MLVQWVEDVCAYLILLITVAFFLPLFLCVSLPSHETGKHWGLKGDGGATWGRRRSACECSHNQTPPRLPRRDPAHCVQWRASQTAQGEKHFRERSFTYVCVRYLVRNTSSEELWVRYLCHQFSVDHTLRTHFETCFGVYHLLNLPEALALSLKTIFRTRVRTKRKDEL